MQNFIGFGSVGLNGKLTSRGNAVHQPNRGEVFSSVFFPLLCYSPLQLHRVYSFILCNLYFEKTQMIFRVNHDKIGTLVVKFLIKVTGTRFKQDLTRVNGCCGAVVLQYRRSIWIKFSTCMGCNTLYQVGTYANNDRLTGGLNFMLLTKQTLASQQ